VTTTAPETQHGGIIRPASWRIELPVGLKLLNENETRRMHWRRVREMASIVRHAGAIAGRNARQHGLPQMRAAHVYYVIHPGPRSVRRDPGNWMQSAKAAVDGALVDAGILADDDSTRLLGPDPRLGAPVKGSQLVLIVTDLDQMHPDHVDLLNPPGATR
jgi:crossover junction endodeoxyribonuclease RusA